MFERHDKEDVRFDEEQRKKAVKKKKKFNAPKSKTFQKFCFKNTNNYMHTPTKEISKISQQCLAFKGVWSL